MCEVPMLVTVCCVHGSGNASSATGLPSALRSVPTHVDQNEIGPIKSLSRCCREAPASPPATAPGWAAHPGMFAVPGVGSPEAITSSPPCCSG